jgi:3-oxoacyl-[acyl-carrier protein] reductase
MMQSKADTKSIIVTGAARGIGKAITLRILREGLSVIALDKDGSALASLESAISDQLDRSLLKVHELDITQINQIESLFAQFVSEKIQPFGLVNNAGILLGTSLLEYSPADINKVLSVNLFGAIYMTQYFGRLRMPDNQAGAIVNLASIAGQIGGSDAIYAISKAGLLGLTKTAAMALAPNIRVNAVAPTTVQTDLIKKVDPERHKVLRQRELLKSPLFPEDVADSVWFLLSDQSKHFTGAVLDINNGFPMR